MKSVFLGLSLSFLVVGCQPKPYSNLNAKTQSIKTHPPRKVAKGTTQPRSQAPSPAKRDTSPTQVAQLTGKPGERSKAPKIRKIQKTKPKPPPRKREPTVRKLTFAVVGDAMSHPRHIKSSYNKDCKCYNFEETFRFVKPYIQKVDVAIANLETTLPGPKGGYTGFPFFGAPDAFSQALKQTGFDVLITANNHIYDKKLAGMFRTLDVLDKQGFQHVGAYRSKKENQRKRYIVIKKNNFNIALLAYTSHVNFYHSIKDLKPFHVNKIKWDDIFNDLKALNKRTDIDMVMASMHCWPEYKNQPHPYQVRRVKWLHKAGVDMILGHHPHVLQPLDMFRVRDQFKRTKDRFVAYSLGNFVSSMRGFYTSGSIILLFTLEKRKQSDGTWSTHLTKVDYVPIWMHRTYNRKTRKWSYLVLPTKDFEDNDHDDVKLPKKVHRRMMQYQRFVHRHLRKGIRNIRRMLKKSSKKAKQP
ncbi:MAG: CapA family protein [Deltaproteobacteria bacterium]|nr:MAG: CapA family protein [Deltaproteobacteria bacterium]